MVYVNFRGAEGVETVDEFSTWKEARKMLDEYRMAFAGAGLVYLSQRATRAWREACSALQ